MNIDKSEIIRELKKAMRFYNELGFEYLPVRNENITDLFNEEKPLNKQKTDALTGVQPADSIQHKSEALKLLRDEIGDCRRCKLWKHRQNIVFGEGSSDAALMFIGEGPGREEDIHARPFVGDAGKLLTKMIIKMGMKREGVYIANIVKCRPPSNRNPEEDEIAACRPFVEKQVEIINPDVIMSLGRISANALTGAKIPISRLRGNFFDYRGIPLMPTFHPAYLMRNPKDKWLTWDDVQQVLAKLNT
jgi:DNA polymerase